MTVGVPIGKNIGAVVGQNIASPSLSPEALALFARMTVQPSDARKVVYNNTISTLIQSGIWSKLIGFYQFDAHDAQAARLNWVAANSCTAVNAPTFTTDRGYTGDGATSYLDTGILETTLDTNSVSFGVYVRTDTASDTRIAMGSQLFFVRPMRSTDSLPVFRCSSAAVNSGAAVGTPVGFTSVSRTGAANYKAYKNGAVNSTITQASGALGAFKFLFLAREDVSVTGYTTAQESYGFIGSGLTDGEMATLFAACEQFRTAVGA